MNLSDEKIAELVSQVKSELNLERDPISTEVIPEMDLLEIVFSNEEGDSQEEIMLVQQPAVITKKGNDIVSVDLMGISNLAN